MPEAGYYMFEAAQYCVGGRSELSVGEDALRLTYAPATDEYGMGGGQGMGADGSGAPWPY